MLHSHIKVWVHLIWSTKNRSRILHKELRSQLFTHLIEKGAESEIIIEKLNIQPEHVHLLFNLPADNMLQNIVKNFKGESSRWINENSLVKTRFKWQRGYGAFSVSSSRVDVVNQYIANQDEHHRKKSFAEEYELFLEKYVVDPGNR